MNGLFPNVLANILAAIALLIIGWIVSLILRLPFVYKNKRRLFEFFGLTKDLLDINVYLSTVFVRRGGSTDFRGIARTFFGPAIPSAELSVIQPFNRLFSNPFLDSLPDVFRNWLGEKVHWSFKRINPSFNPSPVSTTDIRDGNIIAVGSHAYNTASDLYIKTMNPIKHRLGR